MQDAAQILAIIRTGVMGNKTHKVKRIFAEGWRSSWRRRFQKKINFVTYFQI